ncbi:hypothetical protein [Ilumatobacter sp.]|uniref:hypothetical protein n=1 Tax=Ilumatobacter sp. TaxID=1967498 RepID=UPI003B52D358
MGDRRRAPRRLAVALAVIVGWCAILLFAWALRPIDDTVPVVIDPAGPLADVGPIERARVVADNPRDQVVECLGLFDSAARDDSEPLPALAEGFVYGRAPCDEVHTGARLAFALNSALAVVALGAWIALALRAAGRLGGRDPGRDDPARETERSRARSHG